MWQAYSLSQVGSVVGVGSMAGVVGGRLRLLVARPTPSLPPPKQLPLVPAKQLAVWQAYSLSKEAYALKSCPMLIKPLCL